MTPQEKEIIALNRELGEALGHLQGLTQNSYYKIPFSTVTRINGFIKKIKERKSFLE